MTETLADLFAEARTLLEGKLTGVPSDGPQPIPGERIAWTEIVADPAYNALRKVVVEICPIPVEHHCDVTDHIHPSDPCKGTGVVLRTVYWEQAPDKALEGALLGAVRSPDAKGEIHYSAAALSEVLLGILCRDGDTRIPAMQAVVEWLKGEPHG